jgi:LCP family protein required for cell wall assembly
VNIPGYGYHKINSAYVYGQADHFKESGYPNGGMGLLEKVIEQTFQIPVNYYGLVNYNAMKDAVNAVGGIDITIKSEDPRGIYDPSIDWSTNGPLVKLSNGKHHLNGEQALDLARARGDAYGSYGFAQSDFDRTANQRKMLVALKSKIVSSSTLANPIKIGKLLDAVGKNVKTDFKASEAHRLYDLSKKVKNSSIKSLSLNDADGKNLLTSYESADGESALIPAAGINNYGPIDIYIKKQFSNDPIVKEAATVVVLNGTNTYGLAAKKSHQLEAKGVDVIATADARSLVSSTTIIDNSRGKKPATRRLLANTYGRNFTKTNNYANVYNADFIVLLGTDQIARQ